MNILRFFNKNVYILLYIRISVLFNYKIKVFFSYRAAFYFSLTNLNFINFLVKKIIFNVYKDK